MPMASSTETSTPDQTPGNWKNIITSHAAADDRIVLQLIRGLHASTKEGHSASDVNMAHDAFHKFAVDGDSVAQQKTAIHLNQSLAHYAQHKTRGRRRALKASLGHMKKALDGVHLRMVFPEHVKESQKRIDAKDGVPSARDHLIVALDARDKQESRFLNDAMTVPNVTPVQVITAYEGGRTKLLSRVLKIASQQRPFTLQA